MVTQLITEPIKLEAKDITALQDMAASIALLKNELAKAKRAGIDVAELETRLLETAKLREGLLREYR